MKTPILIGAAAARVAMLVWAAPAQVATRHLDILLAAEKPSVRLGEPMKVSVRVTNQAPQEAEASRSATAFDCFEVTGPDGKTLPYVGFDGQIMLNPVQVPPASTVPLGDLDLTDKYLFEKTGRYSIRFTGGGTGLRGSLPLLVEVTPGQLSEFDRVVACLLPVCPKGWHLAKDAHGEVTPFGRSPVEGFALHLCHNHMHAEAVYLWFVKTEPKTDPAQTPRVNVESLGRARELYVYAGVDKNTPALWPTAVEEISRALQLTKE